MSVPESLRVIVARIEERQIANAAKLDLVTDNLTKRVFGLEESRRWSSRFVISSLAASITAVIVGIAKLKGAS